MRCNMNKPPTLKDLQRAHECLEFMTANLTLHYNIEGDEWDSATYEVSFSKRSALIEARLLLIEEMGRLLEFEGV